MPAQFATLTREPAKQPSKDIVRTPVLSVRRRLAAPGGSVAPTSLGAIPAFAPDERGSGMLPLQRKLAIGAVNDPLESEADAMAERVMNMSGPVAAMADSGAPPLRRKCACEGSGAQCDHCKEERQNSVQLKAARLVTPTEAPPMVHEVLRSPGQPLDPAARDFFELRFGRDFSKVRVHTDADASASARAVHAQAYTVGQDVVFDAGKYAPGTVSGQRLLAHELTHVIQQESRNLPGTSGGGAVRRQPQSTVDSLHDTTETVDQLDGPTDPEELAGRDACPVTARFLSTVAGPQKANCLVDKGKYGASKLAQFRVVGAPVPPGGLTVTEQFTAVDDTCGLFGLLKPVSSPTDGDGKFDDCYRLQSDHPLPPECRLTVEQNHLLNGQIISKNKITFSSDSVSFCHYDRLPGQCDFGGRCKL
jgi:hypothetical protein